MDATRLAAAIGRAGLDWLYPRRCLACDDETADVHGLCAACWRETAFIDGPICRRCGAAQAFDAPDGRRDAGPEPCPACFGRPARWTEARAAARYGGGARRLALALKHGDRLEAAQAMGAWMARAGADLLAPDCDGARPWLTPAPLHWRRRLARRENQAAALAAVVSRRTGAPLAVDALRRIRRTPALDGLDRAARAAALDGAVQAARRWRGRLSGARVVIVDDVLTTGATLNACVDALSAAGARRVDALVFARADRRGDSA